MSDLIIRKAERRAVRARVLLAGPSKSGKTFGALALASGLTGDITKVVMIDTERGSGDMYGTGKSFSIISLSPPHSPHRYIEALQLAEKTAECIIIDSLTHEWAGIGGCLQMHQEMGAKNSYTAWGRIKPQHARLIDVIHNSTCHVIATVRTKDAYVLNEKNQPVKVGMELVQQNDLEYEFDISLRIDRNHVATCVGDRTGTLSEIKTPLTKDHGAVVRAWLEG